MRNKLLFILFFSLAFAGSITNISAQAYKPMAIDGAHWIIVFHNEQTVIPVDGLWEYYCNGDTIINNTEYKKVYKRDLEITQSGPPFVGISPYQIAGFLRDDTIERKVYSIDWETNFFDNCPDGEEHLLFDFSLEVGDSTDFCLYSFGQNQISEIYYANIFNQVVKIFYTSFDSFYEGIGSQYGLFETMIMVEFYSTSLDYYCPETPCDYLVSSKDVVIPDYLKIFPNPASEHLTLSYNPNDNWQKITLYNSLGIVSSEHTIPPASDHFSVSIDRLTPGIYHCGLSGVDKKSPLFKVVVVK